MSSAANRRTRSHRSEGRKRGVYNASCNRQYNNFRPLDYGNTGFSLGAVLGLLGRKVMPANKASEREDSPA